MGGGPLRNADSFENSAVQVFKSPISGLFQTDASSSPSPSSSSPSL